MALPFIGGLVLTVGALSNNSMVIGLYIPFQVIGIIYLCGWVPRWRQPVLAAGRRDTTLSVPCFSSPTLG